MCDSKENNVKYSKINFYNDSRLECFSDQTCLRFIRSLDISAVISAGSKEAHQQKRQNYQRQKENAEKTVKRKVQKL